MKYLYGDSTESVLQRDMLGLLDYFIDTSVKAVTLENSVFKLKEDIKNRRRLRNSVLEEMDIFLSTIEDSISAAVTRSKEQETIIQYARKGQEFFKKFINEGKSNLSDDISREMADLEEEVNKTNEENREILESFFIQDPVPILNKKYTLKADKEGYSAKVEVDYNGEISCVFRIASSEVLFWKRHIKAFDFFKGIKIPVKMKKPFLKNELVPDIIILDYYYLTDLILSEKKLEVVFRRTLNVESERVRFKMNFADGFTADVYYAEEKGVEKDIQAVPELRSELNIFRLQEIGNKILEQTNELYSKKDRLETIHIEGKDAISENLVFELMERVAEIFAPTVKKIKKHTPSEEELSLKEEDDTGKRREIYLKKSQVEGNLSLIGEKGEHLLKILKI